MRAATNNAKRTVTYAPKSGFADTEGFGTAKKKGCGAPATGGVSVADSAPPPPQCFEDDDPHIAYDNGWHTVSDPNASAGHFHLNTGQDVQHGLKFTFQLQSDTGTLQYFFATSTKGGSAQVLIDGHTPMSNQT